MKKWDIHHLEFDPAVWGEMQAFVRKHPEYEEMLKERLDDLLEFPDLFWQEAYLLDENVGYFVTRHQQIELSGKVDRSKGRVLVTHFSFRH